MSTIGWTEDPGGRGQGDAGANGHADPTGVRERRGRNDHPKLPVRRDDPPPAGPMVCSEDPASVARQSRRRRTARRPDSTSFSWSHPRPRRAFPGPSRPSSLNEPGRGSGPTKKRLRAALLASRALSCRRRGDRDARPPVPAGRRPARTSADLASPPAPGFHIAFRRSVHSPGPLRPVVPQRAVGTQQLRQVAREPPRSPRVAARRGAGQEPGLERRDHLQRWVRVRGQATTEIPSEGLPKLGTSDRTATGTSA